MYQITISQTQESSVTKREYQKIGEDENGQAKYGYVSSTGLEPVTTTIFSQILDEIDLEAIIIAINKID